MSTETPTFLDVLQFVVDDDRSRLHVALPAKVESYDAAAQTVVVKPQTKRIARNADDDRIVDELPSIPAVPVSWPRGGGYFMSMPLAAGDGGMIICCDVDLGAWRDSGLVSDPGDERRHGLQNAIFVPGLETVARALLDATAGHLVVGKDGGPAIHIDPSFVQLGAAGGQFVALANLVQAAFTTLKGATSTALGGIPSVGTGLKGTFDTATGGVPGSLGATLVKAT